MNADQHIAEAEQIVATHSVALLAPHPHECLVCYLDRQLGEFGCDGTHRFAISFRDAAAPLSTALLRSLAAMGGCCCDCEVILNAFERVGIRGLAWDGWDGWDGWDDQPPDESAPPPCSGVRRGSTQPCALWIRRIRR